MNPNDTQKIIDEVLSRIPKEELTRLVKTASRAHTAEDIKEIAAGCGQTLTDEQAELLLYLYGEEVPLSPDFLDAVSGGAEREIPTLLC